jgi:hypothetical protein
VERLVAATRRSPAYRVLPTAFSGRSRQSPAGASGRLLTTLKERATSKNLNGIRVSSREILDVVSDRERADGTGAKGRSMSAPKSLFAITGMLLFSSTIPRLVRSSHDPARTDNNLRTRQDAVNMVSDFMPALGRHA